MNTDVFQLDFGSDQDRWEQLLNEIDAGNVIPVIGPDLLVEPKMVQGKDGMRLKENLHQQLISYIASQTRVHSCPRTFSQLVYDENYKQIVRDDKKIYNLIHQIIGSLEHIEAINSRPSQLLMDLLGTKKFPFVITTSFTPIVENAMREIYGNVKVLNFNRDPQSSSWERGGDIRNQSELSQPTVYYMFGKECNSRDTRFVVTDADMMTFCSSWIKGEGVPKTLTESLKNKYLLILGNNYQDWLFRFIWYGLRATTSGMKTDIVVNDNAETSFKQFLDRLETFFQESPAEVVRRIKEDMATRRPATKDGSANYETDVFISYSRSDKAVAQNLYDKLTKAGIRVWFDAYNIPRGEDWNDKIRNGINTTRLFLPILSHNIEQEAFVPHEYRSEWTQAAHVAARMGGRMFIVPFAEDGFDFYNPLTKLPQEFVIKNATWYKTDADIDEICEVVLRSLKELDELEKKIKNA